MIKILNDTSIEVISVSNIYRNLDNDEYELIRENTTCKKSLNIYDITEVSQVLSDYGYPLTYRTQLDIRMKDPITVIGKYQDFRDIIFKQSNKNKIGYEHNKHNSSTV